MLILDLRIVGNKLYEIRKRKGLSRSQTAERAGLSDRAYADIERGTANMRIKTFLNVCEALKITPDEALTEDNFLKSEKNELFNRLNICSENECETALKLLAVYLDSIGK